MNIIFSALLTISLIAIIFVSPSSALLSISTAGASAVSLCIKMVGIYAVWLAVFKLMEACKLSDGLSFLLRPIMKLLFHNLSKEGQYYVSMNMSANLLGLGNAATPMGIAAAQEIKNNTYNLAMLLTINATSIQLLPTTILSLLAEYKSTNPTSIILPSFIATVVSTIVGILLVMVFYRKKKS